MEHKGTVTLNTNRLILRRITLDDASNMFNNWASNKNVTKYMTWDGHKSVEETKMIISSWINSYSKETFYHWVIELKEINEVIGTISVVDKKEDVGEVELGYCISEAYWNKGLMSEAVKEVIKFFFEEVKANRVCASHAKENPSSGKVMKKCNMTYEGTLRQAVKASCGKICDLVCYSILKDEYKQQ